MTETTLKNHIQEEVKTAMRAKDQKRLTVLRLLSAAIKQREVDERISLDDTQIVAVIEKMIKQRRDSSAQFRSANRQDLVDQETFELELLHTYMPTPLTEGVLVALIKVAIAQAGAKTAQDMGKVMTAVKPQIQGRADMGKVSALVKQLLT